MAQAVEFTLCKCKDPSSNADITLKKLDLVAYSCHPSA